MRSGADELLGAHGVLDPERTLLFLCGSGGSKSGEWVTNWRGAEAAIPTSRKGGIKLSTQHIP